MSDVSFIILVAKCCFDLRIFQGSSELWCRDHRMSKTVKIHQVSCQAVKTFSFFLFEWNKMEKKGSRRNECNQNSSTFFRFSSREDLRFINSRSLTEVKCIPPGKHGKNRPSPTSETLALPLKKCIAPVIEQTPVQTSVDTDEPLVCAASLLGPSQLWTSRPSAVREEHNERVLLKHMGSECLP